jgi:hypothetical protein
MSARHMSMAMGMFLALGALPAAADSAKPRGSSSDDHSAGSRHHASSPDRSTPSAVSRGSGSSPTFTTDAQSRHPRAGSGSGHASRYSGYRYSRYYSPYRFYGYGYGGFPYFDYYYGYGYGPYYGAPYAGG